MLVSIASMLLGSFAAIGQTNIKRLMAYSSIGHMGYALVGLAVGTAEGVRGVMVYMVTYVFMSRRGVRLHHRDAAAGATAGPDRRSVRIGDGRTPGWRWRWRCSCSAWPGIPPFSGLLRQAVRVPAGSAGGVLDAGGDRGADQRWWGRSTICVIIKVMYFDPAEPAFDPRSTSLTFVATVGAVVTTLFFVVPSPLVAAANSAARVLFN